MRLFKDLLGRFLMRLMVLFRLSLKGSSWLGLKLRWRSWVQYVQKECGGNTDSGNERTSSIRPRLGTVSFAREV